MTAFINVVLLIVNVVFFAVTVLVGIWCVYEQIMGSEAAEKLLKKLHIPLSYTQTFVVGVLSMVLMMFIYLLREKLSGRM